MSFEKLHIESIQSILEKPSLLDAVLQLKFTDEIQSALTVYLNKKDQGVLKFLVGEEEFSKALYELLTEDKTIDTLESIYNYLSINNPEQEILSLEERYFSRKSEFCDYFGSKTGYRLNNKQIAKIIAKWPDHTHQSKYIPLIRSFGYIDIHNKLLKSELYLHKANYISENKVQLKGDGRILQIIDREQEHIFVELNRLFPDKTIYEIFDIDPSAVINASFEEKK